MQQQVSAHFSSCAPVIRSRLGTVLEFLLLEQGLFEVSSFDHTQFIGDPKWKPIPRDRMSFVDKIEKQASRDSSKPILLSHQDPSYFNVLITEIPESLAVPPPEPALYGSASSNFKLALSSISTYMSSTVFQDVDGVESLEKTEKIISFLVSLFAALDADVAHAHELADSIALDGSGDKFSFIPGALGGKLRMTPGAKVVWPLQSVYWANLFSARWRDTIEQTLSSVSAPGLEIRSLAAGRVLVLTASSPLGPTDAARRNTLWSVWSAVGLGARPNRFLLWKLGHQWRE